MERKVSGGGGGGGQYCDQNQKLNERKRGDRESMQMKAEREREMKKGKERKK